MRTLTPILTLVTLISLGCAEGSEIKVTDPLLSEVVKATGEGKIKKQNMCSPKMGEGGNYSESGKKLSGKCQNGGKSPALVKDPQGKHFVFWSNPASGSENTRTELASPLIPFNQTAKISFLIRIPEGAAKNPPGQMFYALQLWQCAPLSPIAGIRVTEGSSHSINFITRHQNSSSPTIASLDLTPGEWTRIEIKVTPSLDPDRGYMGVFANGRTIANWRGAFGSNPTLCESPPNSDKWRVKFGIYRSPNNENSYEVNFDDFRVEVVSSN